MKSNCVFLTVMLALMWLVAYGCSEKPEASKARELESENAPVDSVAFAQGIASDAWNKFCPVRGWAVDPKSPTLTYKGKVIGFCCPNCDETFNEDPDRYLQNLSEDGSQFNISG